MRVFSLFVLSVALVLSADAASSPDAVVPEEKPGHALSQEEGSEVMRLWQQEAAVEDAVKESGLFSPSEVSTHGTDSVSRAKARRAAYRELSEASEEMDEAQLENKISQSDDADVMLAVHSEMKHLGYDGSTLLQEATDVAESHKDTDNSPRYWHHAKGKAEKSIAKKKRKEENARLPKFDKDDKEKVPTKGQESRDKPSTGDQASIHRATHRTSGDPDGTKPLLGYTPDKEKDGPIGCHGTKDWEPCHQKKKRILRKAMIDAQRKKEHKKKMKKAREAARIHKVHHKAKKMLKKKLDAENDAIAQRVQRDATRRLAKHQLKSNEALVQELIQDMDDF